MPISNANLLWYLSGGSGNTDANASLGGARSTTLVPTGLAALFDNVSGAEAAAGDIEYRCIYFRNEDADADGLIEPKFWINALTSSGDSEIDVGVDPAGKNGTATTIANESTAPAGVTFTRPTTKGGGLALPGTPYVQNEYVAVWIRRTVSAAAAATASDASSLRIEGDTV